MGKEEKQKLITVNLDVDQEGGGENPPGLKKNMIERTSELRVQKKIR